MPLIIDSSQEDETTGRGKWGGECELEKHALPEEFTLIFRNKTMCI